MPLPRQPSMLHRRNISSPTNYVWIVLGALTVFLVILVLLLNHLRNVRIKRSDPPPYIPTKYLKQKWREWTPSTSYDQVKASSTRLVPRPSTEGAGSSLHATNSDTVDRQPSVRSIVSLPPYNVAPLPSERLIAREGERAGVDTIVDFPETEGDAEARREEEMEALYSIRQARRREQAEREARRIERREARERGDWRRLERLEQESRARARTRAATTTTTTSSSDGALLSPQSTNIASAASSTADLPRTQDSAYLIAELNSLRESNTSSRRISSVSYQDLGLARHDGSRIRADSADSDHRPLLDSAASIGIDGSGRRSRAMSATSTPARSRTTSMVGHVRHGSSEDPTWRASSFEEPVFAPLSITDLPPEPPSYDDDASVHGGEAPPYESSAEERAPSLPPVPPLPSPSAAHVAGSSAPTVAPVTPSGLRQEVRLSLEEERVSEGVGQETLQEERGRQGPAQLRLRTGELQRHTPAIEVMSATPVNSVPATPVEREFRMEA